jgi:HEAT repeat protein
LSAALKDNAVEIRQNAILGLRDLQTPGATTLLESYLPEADEATAPIVAQALAVMPDGAQVLKDAVQQSDLLVRRAAVHGLSYINEPWTIELMEEIIRTDPEWLVRSAAETALASQQEELDKQHVILPQPKVEEVEWLIRWAARQGTGLGVGEAAMEMLIRAVQQGDANTKVLGVLTLNQIGRQDHLAVLQPLLHDPDELVKVQTQAVITNITNRYQIYLGA